MQEHRTDDQQNQDGVNDPHPAHGNGIEVPGVNAVFQMDLGEGELLRHSLVALATGGIKVGAIDGGTRIARRQDVMHAMATSAVGCNHRTAFRRKAVITVHIRGHAVSGYAELLRKTHALVAARAGGARDVLLGDR